MVQETVFDSLAGSLIKQLLRCFIRTFIILRDACLRRHDGTCRLSNVSAKLVTRSAELAIPWRYSVAFGNNIPVAEGDKIVLRNGKFRRAERAMMQVRHWAYRTNAIATPPSTFNTLPVDLCSRPPINTKQALAISSGKIISFSRVRFA